MIYEELLLDTHQGVPSGFWLIHPRHPHTEPSRVQFYHPALTILRTCKSIHAEAFETLYKNAFNVRLTMFYEQATYSRDPLYAPSDYDPALGRIKTLRVFLDIEQMVCSPKEAIENLLDKLVPQLQIMHQLQTLVLQIRLAWTSTTHWNWQSSFAQWLMWLVSGIKPYVPHQAEFDSIISYPSAAWAGYTNVDPTFLMQVFEMDEIAQGSKLGPL